MKINVVSVKPELVRDNLLVIPLAEEDAAKGNVSYPKSLIAALESKDFKAELNQTLVLYAEPSYGAKRIMCLGLGKRDELDKEKVRRAYSTAGKAARSLKVNALSIVVPTFEKIDLGSTASCIVEGLMLGSYSFSKYKTEKKDVLPELIGLTLILSERKHEVEAKKAAEKARIVCENVIFARNLVNENSKDKGSLAIEGIARKIARANRLRLNVLTEHDMKRLGMNLMLAVNSGSRKPPRLLILSYNGNVKSKDKYAVVGKGIIFDSGGLNLKLTGNIETMKIDMAGAATAFSTVKLASELKLKINLIALMPLCENMIGSAAYKPGDVFIAYNKKTVEITNTDAEGRLILADALAYAVDKIRPKMIVDLATLTGACIVALGKFTAGFMGNDKNYADKMMQASRATGEQIWELPLSDDFKDMQKSQIADMVNSSKTGGAGAIEGGMFLKNFVGKTPWIHLDIAGPAYMGDADFNYMVRGGTGFGVRLLLDFFEKV